MASTVGSDERPYLDGQFDAMIGERNAWSDVVDAFDALVEQRNERDIPDGIRRAHGEL